MSRGQGIRDDRLPTFFWVSLEAMKAMQRYFAEAPKASLSQGIALYAGIAFMLSDREKDGRHEGAIRATRKEVGIESGMSATSVSRYADHLIAAEVIDVEEREGQAFFWRLIEPDPYLSGEGVETPDPRHTGNGPSPQRRGGSENRDHSGEGTNKEEETAKKEEGVETTPFSPEVERLCALMVDLQNERVGGQEWTVTHTGREEMRRILELDKRPVEEVERAIRWVHGHHFWSANVLSPKKLRQKFPQLKADAIAEGRGGSRKSSARRERTERRMGGVTT